MNEGTGSCWNCSFDLTHLDYGRGDRCHQCGRDTRVCKGCVHYDSAHYNECRESQADRVVEKERSNFCDYFRPKKKMGTGGGFEESLEAKARALAEALFKK